MIKYYNDKLNIQLKKSILESNLLLPIIEKITGKSIAPYTFFKKQTYDRIPKNYHRVTNPEVIPFNLFKIIILKKTISIEEAELILSTCPDIVSVSRIPIPELCLVPNDTYWDNIWFGVENNVFGMDSEEAWDIETTMGEGIVIATIEPFLEGCRYTHEDFGGSQDADIAWDNIINGIHPAFLPSRYPADGDYDRPITFGHNTMTASDVGARINNFKGFAGTAPNVKIMLVYYGHYTWDNPLYSVDDTIPNAIIRAVDQGADIINLSLSGNYNSDIASVNAVNYAVSNGVLVLWAMGLNSVPAEIVDNNIPNTISISSHDPIGNYHYNYGTKELSAPGVSIWRSNAFFETGCVGDNVNNYYKYGSGNSNATPIAAGAAVLLMKKNPTWNLGDIRQALHQGCQPGFEQSFDGNNLPIWDKYFGYGCVNSKNSLNLELNSLKVLSPMNLQKVYGSSDYRFRLSWNDDIRQTNYLRTIIVCKENSYPTTPIDGEVIYNGTDIITSNIWRRNGSWYFTIFNINNFENYSMPYGDIFDSTMNSKKAYYQINTTSYISPVAYFTQNITSGLPGLIINFDDMPIGRIDTAYFLWNFGDSTTSVQRNPVKVYNQVGVYTVSYTCGNPLETSTVVKENLITIMGAQFVASSTSIEKNFPISFTNQSIGTISAYLWDFGDGNISTEINPSHTYIEVGIYTVSLTVITPFGNHTETKLNYITVTSTLKANFSRSGGDIVLVSDIISFQDLSEGTIISYLWNFGDGNISDLQNPIHAYSIEGTFIVTLIITGNDSRYDSTTQTIGIKKIIDIIIQNKFEKRVDKNKLSLLLTANFEAINPSLLIISWVDNSIITPIYIGANEDITQEYSSSIGKVIRTGNLVEMILIFYPIITLVPGKAYDFRVTYPGL